MNGPTKTQYSWPGLAWRLQNGWPAQRHDHDVAPCAAATELLQHQPAPSAMPGVDPTAPQQGVRGARRQSLQHRLSEILAWSRQRRIRLLPMALLAAVWALPLLLWIAGLVLLDKYAGGAAAPTYAAGPLPALTPPLPVNRSRQQHVPAVHVAAGSLQHVERPPVAAPLPPAIRPRTKYDLFARAVATPLPLDAATLQAHPLPTSPDASLQAAWNLVQMSPFERYALRALPDVSPQLGIDLAAEGHALVAKIGAAASPTALAAATATTSDGASRQAAALVWYLMQKAVVHQAGFVEGAFVCYDVDQKVAAYFRHLAYKRLSSHLPHHPGSTFGIDVTPGDGAVKLPWGHRHVLFKLTEGDAQRGEPARFFIKPEPHGTRDLSDFLRHSSTYLLSLMRRVWGSNDGAADARKERIPQAWRQEFCRLASRFPNSTEALARLEGGGIHAMLLGCYEACGDPDTDKSVGVAAETFLQKLTAVFPWASVQIGNEVTLFDALSLADPRP